MNPLPFLPTARFLLITAIVVSGSPGGRAYAQTVYIPDLELRTALNDWVPGAVDADGNMDPANPAIIAMEELTLQVDWSPADLTGIDALDHLSTLVINARCYVLGYDSYVPCDSILLDIPDWPSGLSVLTVSSGTWNLLPSFPANLIQLSVDQVYCPVIPSLPLGLTHLSIFATGALTAFPELPDGLEHLHLVSAGQPFPGLPGGITWLNLRANGGIPLPALPGTVEQLTLEDFSQSAIPEFPVAASSITIVSMGNLEALPALPPMLRQLHLSQIDSLAAIPVFPGALEQLSIWILPGLASLPPWPNSIKHIFLAELPLTELLPLPPGLISLDLTSLPGVTCLPLLPESLEFLMIDADGLPLDQSGISCLPNIPSGMAFIGPGWGPLSGALGPSMLCTPLNSDCDFLNPVVTGMVYWDQNANGLRDPGEPGYPYATLHQQPGAAMHGVMPDGTYAWPMPQGEYVISASSTNPYVQAIGPEQIPVTLEAGEIAGGNDFGVVLAPGNQDLNVDLTGPYGIIGYETTGTITCRNAGTVPVDATVTFHLDAHQDWVGATPEPQSVAGNTITWSLPALQVGQSRTIALTVYTGIDVPIATPLEQLVELGPLDDDVTPGDNVATSLTTVYGSFDPNDKLVRPASLSPAELAADTTDLVYTIRFQNTGNWPAMKVELVDTLSTDLQWSAFKYLSSSHPCSWQLTGDGVLSFLFDPIVLPDSATDALGSQGFVKFAIKPSSMLPLGAAIANTAHIFFDYNPAITTEPAVFTVMLPDAVAEIGRVGIRAYPNPVRDVLWLEPSLIQRGRLVISDCLGRELHAQEVDHAGRIAVSMSHLPSGIYMATLRTAEGSFSARIAKE